MLFINFFQFVVYTFLLSSFLFAFVTSHKGTVSENNEIIDSNKVNAKKNTINARESKSKNVQKINSKKGESNDENSQDQENITPKQKYRLKMRDLAREARADPTKMTPRIEKYINDGRKNRKNYVINLTKKVKQGNATEKQIQHYHKRLRTKYWRSLSKENEIQYQNKNKLNRERGKKSKQPSLANTSTELANERMKKELGVQTPNWTPKRVLNIDLNQPAPLS